jgi:hypothetical protein
MVVATVTITTPNNASADTMAITTNVVLLFISKLKPNSFSLRVSAINHCLFDNFCRLLRIMVAKNWIFIDFVGGATNSSTNTHFSTPKRDAPEDDKTELIFAYTKHKAGQKKEEI